MENDAAPTSLEDRFKARIEALADRPPKYKYHQLKKNHETIEKALANGWKIADFVAALNDDDFEITVPTFKLYLHRMRKEAGMVKPRNRKGR